MSSTDAAAPAKGLWDEWLPRLSGWARWPTLILAVFGFFSAIEGLVPSLMRFSRLLKLLVGFYSSLREALYDWLQIGFSWLTIRLPEIDPLWKDGLMIAGLLYAALNFESLRRDRTPLHLAFFREISSALKSEDGGTQIFHMPEHPALTRIAFGIYYVLNGALLSVAFSQFGVRLPLAPVPAFANIALQIAAFTALAWLVRMGIRQIYERTRGRTSDATLVVLEVLWVPTYLVLMPFLAFYNGWRAVTLALGIVALIAGLNALFVYQLDPMLAHPPGWWTDFVGSESI